MRAALAAMAAAPAEGSSGPTSRGLGQTSSPRSAHSPPAGVKSHSPSGGNPLPPPSAAFPFLVSGTSSSFCQGVTRPPFPPNRKSWIGLSLIAGHQPSSLTSAHTCLLNLPADVQSHLPREAFPLRARGKVLRLHQRHRSAQRAVRSPPGFGLGAPLTRCAVQGKCPL